MGNGRFFYNNYITSSTMITATSLIGGYVTAPYKEGWGNGNLNSLGQYTGSEDLEYVVEIDSTVSGNEKGFAEFRWRDGDTWDGSTMNCGLATNMAPSTLDEMNLSNGVKVVFTTGAGNDFELGDIWYFRGINLFNPGKLIDLDRNTRYRNATAAGDSLIKIDLATPREVQALVIYDHNFSSGATLVLKGGTDTVCSAFSTAITWNENKIIMYPTTGSSYQYWQISIEDTASTNLEFSELYLGSYWEPSDNFQIDSDHPIEIVTDKYYTPGGVRRDIYRNQKKNMRLVYPYMKTTDRDNFNTMINALGSQDTKQYKPVFFNLDSTRTTETYLYKINSPQEIWNKGRYSLSMELEEVTKSV